MTIQTVPIAATPITGIASSEQTIISAGTVGFTKINTLEVVNVTGTAETLTVYLVPSGGSVATGTMVVNALAVAAQETIPIFSAALSIAPGATIQFAASTASSLNVFGAYQVRT